MYDMNKQGDKRENIVFLMISVALLVGNLAFSLTPTMYGWIHMASIAGVGLGAALMIISLKDINCMKKEGLWN